jgi:hypothetical protein
MRGTLASSSAEPTPADLHLAVEEDDRQRDRDHPLDSGDRQLAERRNDVGGDSSGDQEDGGRGDAAAFADLVRQHRGHGRGGSDQHHRASAQRRSSVGQQPISHDRQVQPAPKWASSSRA